MSSRFMPTKNAICMHLSDRPPSQGMRIFSGFSKALKEAREASGRKPETGEKILGVSHGSWLAAIGYMSLVDQIGTCFKPKASALENGNSIRCALKYFTSLSDDEIDALYALRCAFAHDYSLYNINKSRPNLTHCFKVNANANDPLVRLPPMPWDGDYQNKSKNNHTQINLQAFGDLVESICTKLFNLANNDDLEVTLPNGSDELLQRYAFYSVEK